MTVLEQIYELIEKNNLSECLRLMKKECPKEYKPLITLLAQEFISGNIPNYAEFVGRVKVLAELCFEEEIACDLGLLYELNFTHQTEYFTKLVRNCKVVANFILRSVDDFTFKWLVSKFDFHYRQKWKCERDSIPPFDMKNGGLYGLLSHIGNTLGLKYHITPENLDTFKLKITRKLGTYLEIQKAFYVIENAYQFIHSPEFDTFQNIMANVCTQNRDVEHRCIFLFMEQPDNPYTVSCAVSSKSKAVHEIRKEHQNFDFPLLIDLEMIENITENCLENWFENIGKLDFYNKISFGKRICQIKFKFLQYERNGSRKGTQKTRHLGEHNCRITIYFNIYFDDCFLSKNILWNKKSLKSSYEDYLKKFNLKKY
jgi:hypothetical protein